MKCITWEISNLKSTAGSFHDGHAESFSQRRVEKNVTLHQNITNIFMFQGPEKTHPANIQLKLK